jgi:hypothetical protein
MKNAFYFDHDYNARNDQKILELRSEYGWEGYGVYFSIVECLCEGGGIIKRGALGGLSLGLNLPKEQLFKMIDFMVHVGLLKEENGIIFSERVNSHLSFRSLLSEAGKKGGRGNKKPPFSPPLATLKPPPKQERKEKEKKEFLYNEFYDYQLELIKTKTIWTLEQEKLKTDYKNCVDFLFGTGNYKEIDALGNVIDTKKKHLLKLEKQLTFKEFCKLVIRCEVIKETLMEILDLMENWKPLNEKSITIYKSALTFIKNAKERQSK